MNDDRFEELMQDAAHTYRKPPTADFDAMWKSIEATLDERQVVSSIGGSMPVAEPVRERDLDLLLFLEVVALDAGQAAGHRLEAALLELERRRILRDHANL